VGCKKSPGDIEGIWKDELGDVDAKGDDVTVVNDWGDVSAGETTDGTREKAGVGLEGWGPLWGLVLRFRVDGAREGPRESERTGSVGRAGSWGEGVKRVRGTAKRSY